MDIRIAKVEELTQVIDLQSVNHYSEVGKTRRGFLTLRTEFEELRNINNELGVIVAVIDDQVIGYDILMTSKRALEHPVYTRMVTTYQELRPNIPLEEFGVSAQYCVASSHRDGRKVRKIFNFEREVMLKHQLSVSIGEVDEANGISLTVAERLLGYEFIGQYYGSDEVLWHIGEKKLQ
jgi:hypothetical protein